MIALSIPVDDNSFSTDCTNQRITAFGEEFAEIKDSALHEGRSGRCHCIEIETYRGKERL